MDYNKHEQLKKAQLKIAKEIKRVCDKNGIKYFLDAGSMLGAVRHKGFIPWDDDMDIGMLDADYKRFLEIAPNELSDEFFVDNYYNNMEYGLVFSKVRMKDTIYKEKIGPKNAKHQEIFVDVFPYFSRSENNLKRKLQSIRLRILSQIFMAQSNYCVWENNSGISKLKFFPIIVFSKILKKNFIWKKIEKTYSKYKDTNIVGIHDGVCYNHWFYDKDFLTEFCE